MFVYNTVWRDRRVLKEASSLAAHGWSVTVIGLSLASDRRPLHEVTADGVVIRRVPLSLAPPPWRRKRALIQLDHRLKVSSARAMARWRERRARLRRRIARLGERRALPRYIRRWPDGDAPRRLASRLNRRMEDFLRHTLGVARRAPAAAGEAGLLVWLALYAGIDRLTRGEIDWLLNATDRWERFAREAAKLAPVADVYHGHDLSGIGAAVRVRDQHGRGSVVYDAHELYVEAGSLASRSGALKRVLRGREAAAYRRADAVITVNEGLAGELESRYGAHHIALVHNCVSVHDSDGRDRLREALGLPRTARIALYQGALTEVRGLRQLLAAFQLPTMAADHLAFMGFGPMLDEVRGWAAAFPRVHVLPAVPPDELEAWVSTADVSLMVNQPAGRNELLSTPNKLFESLAAGVPVITSDFPERRAIVLDPVLGPLGKVCDPTDPASIASAVRSVLEATRAESDAMRERCRRAAAGRWSWANQEATLLSVYDAITRGPTPIQATEGRRTAA